jgi:outer membrane protein OmpA-like peptidoglycan-associated protein
MMLEGVPLERLSSVGLGASSPIRAGQDEQASAQNRRIAFRITSLASP